MTGAEVISEARVEGFGYLTAERLKIIAHDPATRLEPILVRCHEGRFTAPAQDVEGLIKAVEKGGFYVRDVSLLAQR